MTTTFDQGKLVSIIAFALRHGPEQFDLELDDDGWVEVDDLLVAIRFANLRWATLDHNSLFQAIQGMDRFELQGTRIRAVYGHSIALRRLPDIALPPDVLFHGTALANVRSIFDEGISRMRRQFAHFSSNFDWVVQFLSDKPEWAIFAIDTGAAQRTGTVFRKANDHVWLTDWLDPRFLRIRATNELPQGSPPGDATLCRSS